MLERSCMTSGHEVLRMDCCCFTCEQYISYRSWCCCCCCCCMALGGCTTMHGPRVCGCWRPVFAMCLLCVVCIMRPCVRNASSRPAAVCCVWYVHYAWIVSGACVSTAHQAGQPHAGLHCTAKSVLGRYLGVFDTHKGVLCAFDFILGV